MEFVQEEKEQHVEDEDDSDEDEDQTRTDVAMSIFRHALEDANNNTENRKQEELLRSLGYSPMPSNLNALEELTNSSSTSTKHSSIHYSLMPQSLSNGQSRTSHRREQSQLYQLVAKENFALSFVIGSGYFSTVWKVRRLKEKQQQQQQQQQSQPQPTQKQEEIAEISDQQQQQSQEKQEKQEKHEETQTQTQTQTQTTQATNEQQNNEQQERIRTPTMEDLIEEIQEELGLEFGEEFALKVMTETKIAEQEAFIMKSLDHPNILKLVDYLPSCCSLVLPYCERGTLESYMRSTSLEGVGLDWIEVHRFASQIADAMQYMHSKGVVHRDLRLCNILLSDNLSALVADFGVAYGGKDEQQYFTETHPTNHPTTQYSYNRHTFYRLILQHTTLNSKTIDLAFFALVCMKMCFVGSASNWDLLGSYDTVDKLIEKVSTAPIVTQHPIGFKNLIAYLLLPFAYNPSSHQVPIVEQPFYNFSVVCCLLDLLKHFPSDALSRLPPSQWPRVFRTIRNVCRIGHLLSSSKGMQSRNRVLSFLILSVVFSFGNASSTNSLIRYAIEDWRKPSSTHSSPYNLFLNVLASVL